MAIIYGKAISIGYSSSKPSGGGGGLYSIWLTIPAVATSVTFTAVKGDVSVASTYISNIGAAKITLPETDYEGDWTVSGTVGGKTASQTVTVTSDKNDYFVDMRNDFIPLSGELKVGNLVTFDDKSWRVVHQEGTHWYLAAEEIYSLTAFGSNTTYKGSTLATVAANYQTQQLSATALEYCNNVTVNGVTNKVFVPSYEQVNGGFEYYNSNARRICQYNDANQYWWTSSPDSSSTVYFVRADGSIFSSSPSLSGGFRPHVCINFGYYDVGFDFTYTGKYKTRPDGVVELLSSGDITFNDNVDIDLFLVGGGAGGAENTDITYSAGGGGGSGYTQTIREFAASGSYQIVIGEGGAINKNGGNTQFGSTIQVFGGTPYTYANYTNGGSGGSGGGGAVYSSTASNYGIGGTNGSDGSKGYSSDSSSTTFLAGLGQGLPTHEFNEELGKLYAGGGAGGRVSSTQLINLGGNGGGGNGAWTNTNDTSPFVQATAGKENTGSGGGGYATSKNTKASAINAHGAAGGSGIVCIRKSKPISTDIPLTGTLAVGNLVIFDDKAWRVVHNDGTKWYLGSYISLYSTPFGSNTTYKGSTLAKCCDTYLSNFSKVAKNYMVNITVENVTNKVFIPTHDQVFNTSTGFEYYKTAANRICGIVQGQYYSWWISTPNGSYVYAVSSSGVATSTAPTSSFAFRPHICIDTSLSSSATKTLSGTWTFNDTVNAPSTTLQQSINFTAYNKSMIYIKATPDPFTIVYGETASTNHVVYNTTSKWNYSIAGLQKVTFTSEQEVSDEFYEWFTANATGGSEPVIPDNTITAGTWKFKDIPATINGASQINMSQIFTFQSKGYTFAKMSIAGGLILYHLSATTSTGDQAYSQSGHTWTTNMQTIILPENQTVSEEFYTWFIANTTKQ